MHVPESSAGVGTIVTARSGALYPLVFRQVLRQFILLRILNGHSRDLVATPCAITLRGRRRSITNSWEDACSRLVHQTVLIRHVIRKLGPDTDFLTFVIALWDRLSNRRISLKLAVHTQRVSVRSHVDREVTVRVRLGVINRRRMLSLRALVPLGVHLHASKRVTRALDIAETNRGFDNLLHRTRNRSLLVSLAWGVDGLVSASCCRSVSSRLGFLRISNSSERGCGSYCVDEGAHHSNRERSGSNGSAAAAYSSTLYFLLVHGKKSFP